MSMHLRNSRDMMDPQEQEGWWSSRTGLEQKLIILSSLLFVLSFCLVISIIVINNRKPGGGGKATEGPDVTTTLEPITETTLNNTNTTEVTTAEPPTTQKLPETATSSSTSGEEPNENKSKKFWSVASGEQKIIETKPKEPDHENMDLLLSPRAMLDTIPLADVP